MALLGTFCLYFGCSKVFDLLSPLKDVDLGMILQWRNVPAVRQAMFDQHEITIEEHFSWFADMQADKSKRWFLYLNQNSEPCGVVYFTDIDDLKRRAFWGFYANPSAASGTGLRLSLDALDTAFNDLALLRLDSEVLSTNLRSIRLHGQVGFSQEIEAVDKFFNGKRYIDVIRFRMLRSQWPECRKALQSRVVELDGLAGANE